MKNILAKTLSLFLFAGILISCEEDKIMYGGEDIIMFSNTAKDFAVSEDAGQLSLEVLLSRKYSSDVTVDFEVIDGTAIQGEHYTVSSTSLVVPAGETKGYITISLVDDEDENDSRTFDLRLTTSSVPGAVLGLGGQQGTFFKTITIANDDCPTKFNYWAGDLNLHYTDSDGYDYNEDVVGSLSGSCDILNITGLLAGIEVNTPSLPAQNNNTYSFVFEPINDDGTIGIVSVQEKRIRDNVGTLGEQEVGAKYVVTHGTFNSNTGVMYVEFEVRLFYASSGQDANYVWWSGTNTFTLQ